MRWTLWFDNPNKAALLLAELVLLALAWRRRCPWTGLLLAVGAAVALAFTRSRGGLVALVLGLVPFFLTARRSLPRPHLVLLGGALFAAALAFSGLAARLASSSPVSDASLANRLRVWSAVPRMLLETPRGWGFGEAGRAYLEWYQPLDHAEAYRTLVSTPLTFAVEAGLPLAFGAAALLAVLFALLVRDFRRENRVLPLALWLAFGTGCLFSTLGEAWELWVLPVGAALVYHRRFVCLAAAILAGLFCLPRGRDVMVYGAGPARCGVVCDPAVLGRYPGRDLRRCAEAHPDAPAVAVVARADALPDTVTRVLVTGGADCPPCAGRTVVYLSPDRLPPSGEVYVGALSGAAWRFPASPRLHLLPGVDRYTPHWPDLLQRGADTAAVERAPRGTRHPPRS